MDSESHSSSSSSLKCEVRIIKVNNMNIKSRGVVFVRCYLCAGNRSKVRIESQEMASNSESISFNQSFSLGCLGSSSSIQCLKQETLVFELRRRSNAAPFIRRIQGSKLIGRAQVPWKDVLDSTNMEIEKWVDVMVPQNLDVINPIALQIAIRIQDFDKRILETKKQVCDGRWDHKCGCNSCLDYEFFAIEAALESL